ncbi:AAA family ATPase [Clostridium sp. UBA5712]|uniref:AAA family ATPase n=1 Tax=Clostridium sp. UBA5712 TaxID=1946368 RepID=UPI003216A015
MELIYLYIEKYNNILKNQEINFSPNFHVKIMNKKLIIENKVSYMNELYPNNIKNITMLLGKNGSGKSTILDILGMNRHDRCNESIKRKGKSRSEIVDSYFILYHIRGDYFGIEVMDNIGSEDKITKLFKNNLTNFNFDKINNPFYKVPMGLIVKKENSNFQVVEHFFRQYSPLGYRIGEEIGVNYISNSYSKRLDIRNSYIGKDEENYEYDDYLCKRRYYLSASKEMQYKFINYLNSCNDLYFCGASAAIKITTNFEYSLLYEKNNKDMENWIKYLEKTLYMDKADRRNIIKLSNDNSIDDKAKLENSKKIYKESFILDTLSSYIIHQFVNGICNMIDSNPTKKRNSKGINIDLSNYKHVEFLNNLKKREYIQSNSKSLFGALLNKTREYENLIKVINYYKEDITLKNYDKLMFTSRYLYSRMESEIALGSESRYQIAIEDFINALNLLKDQYFHKRNISISCNSEIDEEVMNVFRIYDNYLNTKYSDIGMRFQIEISNLSEGENNFLDLLSKIFDIITKSKKNKLLILLLDEPDKSLHPEWSRRFIKFLCDEISPYKNQNIQIVLSTHSPFMATDVMSEHIYCLENMKSIEGSKINIYSMNKKNDRIHNTFAANIYEILKDSFILEKTVGEFSYNKIVQLIKGFNKDENDIGYERFLINSIGELPLRKKLEDMYRKKRENNYKLKNSLLEQIKSETNEAKLNKIKEILNGDKV